VAWLDKNEIPYEQLDVCAFGLRCAEVFADAASRTKLGMGRSKKTSKKTEIRSHADFIQSNLASESVSSMFVNPIHEKSMKFVNGQPIRKKHEEPIRKGHSWTAEVEVEEYVEDDDGIDDIDQLPSIAQAGPPHVPGSTESGLKTILSVAEL
jgi:hypothetical protein